MRALIVHPGPDFSVADVFRGWKGALEGLGVDVQTYNTNERLSFYGAAFVPDYNVPPVAGEDGELAHPLKKALTAEQAMTMAMQGLSHQLYTFWPHVVIFVSGFYASAQALQVIKSRKHKIVLLHTESPYQDDEQLIRAQHADINLLNDPANIGDYRALCPRSFYVPHAYDPKVHYPPYWGTGCPKPAKENDFAFIGTIFKSRRDFFERFFDLLQPNENGLRIAMGGAGWDNEFMDNSPLLAYLGHPRGECVDNDVTADAYRNARSGINFYRRESEAGHAGEGWAMGPREVEMAACGLPFVRDPRGESDEVFPFLPSFDGPEDAADKLGWLLADETRREMLAGMARDAVKDRTFENNARFLLRELEKL